MRVPMITPVVKALMAINLIVYLVQFSSATYDRQIVSTLGLHYFTSEKFNPIQLVTYLFVHGSFRHLLSNMLGLFFLGPMLERLWGEKRFLLFYFITGAGGGLFYMALKYYDYAALEAATQAYMQHPDLQLFQQFILAFYPSGIPYEAHSLIPASGDVTLNESVLIAEESLRGVLNTPTIGASGAVFGIMAGFAMLFPNTDLILFPLPIPIKAKYFVALYGLYEVYGGFHPTQGDNIAHFAHIGGMLFAFFLVRFWNKQRNNFY